MSDRPWWKPTVRRSGSATGGPGSIVNTGIMHAVERPLARSMYQRQVQQISPRLLINRDSELAELEAFCAESDSGSYMWWQGPAWAGKSALMAWFVLHPPTSVQIVSFFVTARWAGQDDKNGFLDVVMPQLAEIAGQPMPASLTEATRFAEFLALLGQAAEAARASGKRLVLVVDGLDEDRGVTTGPHAHSIAALLPAYLPEGTRVIVAGRPNPPIPFDVGLTHPLRDPAIVRPLAVSSSARIVREDAERELRMLLYGSDLEQDLLGLLVASGGGLSDADLTELTGKPRGSLWDVQQQLNAVSGRTFARRDSSWSMPSGNESLYILAHEELLTAAIESLGPARISSYRARLHDWADVYCSQEWPSGTPEYLLNGYFRLLQSIGDVNRMVAYAVDAKRHDRILDYTGGDAVAFSEITSAQNALLAQVRTDLYDMLRLNMHREQLIKRNAAMPGDLPGLWVKLGRGSRAEALANSLDEKQQMYVFLSIAKALGGKYPDQFQRYANHAKSRAEAFAAKSSNEVYVNRAGLIVIEVMAALGDLASAESLASSVPGYWREEAMAMLIGPTARNGQIDRAVQLALGIKGTLRNTTLENIVKILAERGNYDEAYSIVKIISSQSVAGSTLSHIAEAAAAVGDGARAAILLDEAERLVLSGKGKDWGGGWWDIIKVAKAAVRIGEGSRIDNLISVIPKSDTEGIVSALEEVPAILAMAKDYGRAEVFARAFSSSEQRQSALRRLAKALASQGDFAKAEAIIDTIEDPKIQGSALAEMAHKAADDGQFDYASRLADRAETTARQVFDWTVHSWIVERLAFYIAKAGDSRRAVALTSLIRKFNIRERALVSVVEAVAITGDYLTADTIVQTINTPDHKMDALIRIAEAAAIVGNLDRAEAIQTSCPNEYYRDRALAAIARAMTNSARFDRAEAIAGTITDENKRADAIGYIVKVVASTGDIKRAESLVISMDPPRFGHQVDKAMVDIVKATAESKNFTAAIKMAKTISDTDFEPSAIAEIAGALALDGRYIEAEETARSITRHPYQQGRAFALMVRAAVSVNDFDRAEDIITSLSQIETNPEHPIDALTALITAVVITDVEHATRIIERIVDTELKFKVLLACAEISEPINAQSFVAEALTLGPWANAIGPIARLNPAALFAIADKHLKRMASA